MPDPHSGSAPLRARGVYEQEIAPPGYRAFNVIYSNGDIAFYQFPEHRVTRDVVRGLRRTLDSDDPILTPLSIVRSSSEREPKQEAR